MANFLGLYRHVHSSHAKALTGEMFVSLGMNAVSGRDIYAEGGLIALADGRIGNRETLIKALKLPEDAPGSVIVSRAYRTWGADYPRRIEGCAVTAVIDRAEERMMLSADRLGAQPVFYAWRGRSCAFASHPDFLLKTGACGRNVDAAGLRELFFSGGMYTPGRTPFRDIRMLEAGCVLIADTRGTRIKRYSLVNDILSKALCAGEGMGIGKIVSEAAQSLVKAEPGVLLSDGLSGWIADALFEKGEARTYRFAENENDEISVRAQKKGFSNTDYAFEAEELSEKLGDVNLALGFPGTGLRDVYMLEIMKKASESETCVLLGGVFRTSRDASDAGDFLKEEIAFSCGKKRFQKDRLFSAMDRFHFALDEEENEKRAMRAAHAYLSLPSYFMRVHMLSAHAGIEAASVLQDERLWARLICPEGEENTENGRGRPEAHSVPGADEILSVAAGLISDDMNPVFPFLDASRVREAIQRGEVYALSRLCAINLWLSQYEAEILPF